MEQQNNTILYFNQNKKINQDTLDKMVNLSAHWSGSQSQSSPRTTWKHFTAQMKSQMQTAKRPTNQAFRNSEATQNH